MKSVTLFLPLFLILFFPAAWAQQLPEGFVYLEHVIPDIHIEMRYLSADNFVGEPIDGYIQTRCILSKPAAIALKQVQEDLKRFGLGLKVYDAYRPKQAVRHFVRWAGDLQDTRMKSRYYPEVDKKDLFLLGYIAETSSHSRGSTVDLTIVSMNPVGADEELDMGTGFDLFSPKSWPDNPSMTPSQRAHRMLLQALMKQHGFEPYPQEWWHFTLKDEPFPNTYFDFPVQ
ncbi:MAG: M15 family metallopeptidase [Deltaproteobacteria bacterium]|nr:M15 family metallopeptidase [Deltaproteobacteria bacterium]